MRNGGSHSKRWWSNERSDQTTNRITRLCCPRHRRLRRELVRSARGTRRHVWRTIDVLIAFSTLILLHLDGQAHGLTTWTPAAYQQLAHANEYVFHLDAVALLILAPVWRCTGRPN
jgi:hypothetical protein